MVTKQTVLPAMLMFESRLLSLQAAENHQTVSDLRGSITAQISEIVQHLSTFWLATTFAAS